MTTHHLTFTIVEQKKPTSPEFYAVAVQKDGKGWMTGYGNSRVECVFDCVKRCINACKKSGEEFVVSDTITEYVPDVYPPAHQPVRTGVSRPSRRKGADRSATLWSRPQ